MIRCSVCNGRNIEQKVWIDPNTNLVLDLCSDEEVEDCWCRDCKKHVNLKNDDDPSN